MRIDGLGLPHPAWRFTTTPEELPTAPWAVATNGWTVRCAPSDRYEFGMPSRHRLKFADVPSVIREFGRLAAADHFVVYPSWNSLFSGSGQFTPDEGLVEAVRGDIAALLRGIARPEVSVRLEPPLYTRRTVLRGNPGILPDGLIGMVGTAIRLASGFAPSATIEWVWTDTGVFYFYDWYEPSRR